MTDDTYVCTVCGDRCVLRKSDPSPKCYGPLQRSAASQAATTPGKRT